VTQNLFAALRRLRRSDEVRTLWVDAACINQADDGEKASQVAAMGSIYRRTSHGLLFIGEEPSVPVPSIREAQSHEVGRTVQRIDAFLQDMRDSLLPVLDADSPVRDQLDELVAPFPSTAPHDFRITPTKPCVWYGDERDEKLLEYQYQESSFSDSIFHAFCLFRLLSQNEHLDEIFYLYLEPSGEETHLTNARHAAHWLATRQWWSRIWTVQECILPRSCTLIYGPVQMPWQLILRGMHNFRRHVMYCCSTVAGVHDMLNFHSSVADIFDIRADHGDPIGDWMASMTLGRLARQFMHREASDNRDKIYALLPLVAYWRNQPPILPDYSQKNGYLKTYCDAVVNMIAVEGTLSPLCQHPEAREESAETLPDFSRSKSFNGVLERYTKQIPLYKACGETLPHVRVTGENVLVMRGLQIDSLKRASTHCLDQRQRALADMIEYWRSVAKDELGNVGARVRPPDGKKILSRHCSEGQ